MEMDSVTAHSKARKGAEVSRTIDLTQKLSDEDREYLLARGREQEVFRNDAEHVGDPESVRSANYIPGTSIDRAEGVPVTPNGDTRVVMGGGDVEVDEDGDELEDTPDSRTVVDGESDDNYDTWGKAELKAELENRELATSGNKGELIARLREDDASAEGDPDDE